MHNDDLYWLRAARVRRRRPAPARRGKKTTCRREGPSSWETAAETLILCRARECKRGQPSRKALERGSTRHGNLVARRMHTNHAAMWCSVPNTRVCQRCEAEGRAEPIARMVPFGYGRLTVTENER